MGDGRSVGRVPEQGQRPWGRGLRPALLLQLEVSPRRVGCGCPPVLPTSLRVLLGSSGRAAWWGVCALRSLLLPCRQRLPGLVLVPERCPVVYNSLLQTPPSSSRAPEALLGSGKGRLDHLAAAGTGQRRLNPQTCCRTGRDLEKTQVRGGKVRGAARDPPRMDRAGERAEKQHKGKHHGEQEPWEGAVLEEGQGRGEQAPPPMP